jgi:uncharacterized protein (TIGR02246 family)
MKRLVNSGAPILALFGTLLFCAAALADPPADVKAVYTAWDRAFNDHDAKRIAAIFTEDAVLIPPSHKIIKGSRAVENFFRGNFEIDVTSHNLELIEVVTSDTHTIVALAKWLAKFSGETFDGTVTHVFQKQPDGTLKIRLHTFN